MFHGGPQSETAVDAEPNTLNNLGVLVDSFDPAQKGCNPIAVMQFTREAFDVGRT